MSNKHFNTPTRITNLESNDQLLYFTSTSLLKCENKITFISDRSGHPNLYSKDMVTGKEKQVTFNQDGSLKSYVYFDGNTNRGFGKASVSLNPESGELYYIQGRKICCVNQIGEMRVLNELPTDQVTAFTHVSSDGSKLCIPTTDARALEYDELDKERPGYDIDERVRTEKLNSYIRVYRTDNGQEILNERVPEAWITHVQFSPVNSDYILYNHEWPSDCGIRRVWLWDGEQHIQLRTEGEGRSRNDWTCHEMWQKDGKCVIYHGSYVDGRCYIGKVDIDTLKVSEIALPIDFQRYGHFTVGNHHNEYLVSDGYFRMEGEPETKYFGGEWISVQRVDWERETITWYPLCKHKSSWDSQDSHPHPIFDHEDKAIYFTSNVEGVRGVYRVDVDLLKK